MEVGLVCERRKVYTANHLAKAPSLPDRAIQDENASILDIDEFKEWPHNLRCEGFPVQATTHKRLAHAQDSRAQQIFSCPQS